MSKIRTAAFGAVVFLGMAASAAAQVPAKSDSARGIKDGGVRRERVEGQRKMRMERGMRARHAMAQLNLSDAQRSQVRAIHAKYQPQLRSLREQIRTRRQAMQRQRQNEIREILTPEQRSKADAAREARARRMEEQAKRFQERARQLRTR